MLAGGRWEGAYPVSGTSLGPQKSVLGPPLGKKSHKKMLSAMYHANSGTARAFSPSSQSWIQIGFEPWDGRKNFPVMIR